MKHIQIQKRMRLLTLLGLHPKQYFEIFNISKLIRLNVYGNPSGELQKILTSFDSQTFNRFTELNR